MGIKSCFPRLCRLQITIPLEPSYLARDNAVAWHLEEEVKTVHQKSVIEFFDLYMHQHPYARLQELEFRFVRPGLRNWQGLNSVWRIKLMRLYPTEVGARNYKIETVRMFDDWENGRKSFPIASEDGREVGTFPIEVALAQSLLVYR